MSFSFAISIFVMVFGLVMYFFIAHAKAQEVGRLMFFAGLLAALLRFAGHASLQFGG